MQRSRSLGVLSVLAAGAILAVGIPALGHDEFGSHGGAILSNGLVKLGVDKSGNLNIPGPIRSYNGTNIAGVRFLKGGSEFEYTADGCTCEGWGVADASSGLTAYANDSTGYGGYRLVSFSASSTTANSVVETTAAGTRKLRVTHNFRPSASPNLFEVEVIIENTGTATVNDLRYRRVMDWDIEPTPFSEKVTIQDGTPRASSLLFTSDNGFASGNPLSGAGALLGGTTNTDFVDSGPSDHGAVFDFGFGALGVGQSKSFRVYYGGAGSLADANAALAAVGSDVYSLGKPNIATTDSRYSVAMFAFKGVGARPLANAGPDQTVSAGPPVVLNGTGSSATGGKSLVSYDWTEGATFLGSGPIISGTLSVGTHVITLTVTDSEGLTDSDQVIVTVERPADSTPPVIQCPMDVHTETDEGRCYATVAMVDITATATDDTDGPIPVTAVRSDGLPLSAPYPVGETTITYTATDAAGNSSTCTLVVTVHDEEAPALSVPDNITQSTDPGLCTAAVSAGTASAADNCGAVSVTGVRSDGQPLNAPFPKGVTTILWTATDAHHNTSAGVQTVTINDTEKPKIAPQANLSVSADAGKCTAVVNFTPSATDNCGDVAVSASPASGTAFPKGTTTVTVTATDSSGNSSTSMFTVTVVDDQAPTANTPGNLEVNTDPGKCTAVVNFDVSADDNCPGATATAVPPSGTAFPKGTTTVVVTATDATGNTSTKSFTVTVKDNEAPVPGTPGNLVVGNDAGKCSAVVTYNVTVSDNCPGATVSATPPSGSTFPKGVTTVVVTAVDAAGNSSTTSFTVTVNDTEAPTAACTPTTNPAGKTDPKSNNPDGFFQLLASDNCDASPGIYVGDSASGFIAGPFKSGDKVKITQAPGVTPNSKPMAGVVVAHIQLKGDGLIWSVDASGNKSLICKATVPPGK